jgi:hypothetical protein
MLLGCWEDTVSKHASQSPTISPRLSRQRSESLIPSSAQTLFGLLFCFGLLFILVSHSPLLLHGHPHFLLARSFICPGPLRAYLPRLRLGYTSIGHSSLSTTASTSFPCRVSGIGCCSWRSPLIHLLIVFSSSSFHETFDCRLISLPSLSPRL